MQSSHDIFQEVGTYWCININYYKIPQQFDWSMKMCVMDELIPLFDLSMAETISSLFSIFPIPLTRKSDTHCQLL